MRELIKLELKKFLLQRNNWMIFGIICILLGIFIYPNSSMDQMQRDYLPVLLTSQLEQELQNVPFWEQTLIDLPGNKAVLSNLEESKISIENIQVMLEGIEEDDWNLYLEARVRQDKMELKATKEGRLYGRQLSEIVDDIELNELLLAGSIKPIFTDYSMQTINFFILLLQHKLIVVFLFVIVFISSHFISSDFEKETYKLIYTQPISKVKILFSKVIAACLINVGWLVTIIGGASLILGFIYGFGNPSYPTKLWVEGEVIYSTASHYLMIGFLMMIGLVLLCIILSFVFSTLFHHTLVAFIGTSLVLFLPFIGMKNPTFLSKAVYFPFAYEEVGLILSGTSNFKDIGYQDATVILPISVISMFILLGIVFKFKKLV